MSFFFKSVRLVQILSKVYFFQKVQIYNDNLSVIDWSQFKLLILCFFGLIEKYLEFSMYITA